MRAVYRSPVCTHKIYTIINIITQIYGKLRIYRKLARAGAARVPVQPRYIFN